MKDTNTQTLYGRLFKQSGRHGSSKKIHVLLKDESGHITPLCSPEDVGIPVTGKTEVDVDCVKCRNLKSK